MNDNMYIRIATTLLSLVLMASLLPAYLPGTDSPQTDISYPLAGRVIVLDPGHGLGSDNVFEGYSEQATMLLLGHLIRLRLTELGATVHMTRSTPEDVQLFARAAYINRLVLIALHESQVSNVLRLAQNDRLTEELLIQAVTQIAEIERLLEIIENIIYNPERYAPIYMNAPFDRTRQRVIHPDLERIFELQDNPEIYQRFLVISLHSNATPLPINTNANGAHVYVISNSLPSIENYFTAWTNIQRSEYFANLILDEIDSLGIVRRGIRNAAFVVLREHNVPAVLVENGFHTNPHDRALLQNPYFLMDLASAYVNAILDYFEFIDG